MKLNITAIRSAAIDLATTAATALMVWLQQADHLDSLGLDGAYAPVIVAAAGMVLVYLRRVKIEAKR